MSLAQWNVSRLKQNYLYFANVTAVISILNVCPFTGTVLKRPHSATDLFIYLFSHSFDLWQVPWVLDHAAVTILETRVKMTSTSVNVYAIPSPLSLSFYLSLSLSTTLFQPFLSNTRPCFGEITSQWGDGHVFICCTDSLRPTEGPFSLSLAPLGGSVRSRLGFLKLF